MKSTLEWMRQDWSTETLLAVELVTAALETAPVNDRQQVYTLLDAFVDTLAAGGVNIDSRVKRLGSGLVGIASRWFDADGNPNF